MFVGSSAAFRGLPRLLSPLILRVIRRLSCGANVLDQTPQRPHYALVAFTEEGGEDVLADALAPEVIAAVAAGVAGRVEIHPVHLVATTDAVAPIPYALALETKTALEAGEIHSAGGVEIDRDMYHGTAPIPSKVTRIRLIGTPISNPEQIAKFTRFRHAT